MRLTLLAAIAIILVPVESEARCSRLPESKSTAFDRIAGRITLPWRTDYPTAIQPRVHAWQAINFRENWRAYIAAVLDEVKASGLRINNKKIETQADSTWWIAPWMDYTANGREALLGLTRERGPDPKDLSPTSSGDHQVWAIGWYNAEGAFGLGRVFADPCDPKIPGAAIGQPWTFPNHTASFKLLFTDTPETELTYLVGAPVVEAMIGPRETSGNRAKRDLRLLQVDIAVRDPQATDTEWVMGTFIWKGPRTGDGLFDNLVPVGLMWGNDNKKHDPVWAKQIALEQTRLNPELAGIIWQGATVAWPERPYPGFQGRLNGPADNLRSSCLSCHGLAQWRRHRPLGLLPIYKLLDPPRTPAQIADIAEKYFKNVKGGQLTDPGFTAISLDYSLQLEAAFRRMCTACKNEVMTGPTPELCKLPGGPNDPVVDRPTCEKSLLARALSLILPDDRQDESEPPPRQ